jgi:hypothetical protein
MTAVETAGGIESLDESGKRATMKAFVMREIGKVGLMERDSTWDSE